MQFSEYGALSHCLQKLPSEGQIRVGDKLLCFSPYFFFLCQFHCFVIDGVFCRQPLLRYKIFWFLVERKRLYNVHKKVNCGGPHLFLLHNLVIRFVAPCNLSRYLHS